MYDYIPSHIARESFGAIVSIIVPANARKLASPMPVSNRDPIYLFVFYLE